jgi:hypothetical protein
MSAAPHDFPIFGLRPLSGADKKMGDRAEAGRPIGDVMLNIMEPAVQGNAPERTTPRVSSLIREGAVTISASEAALILEECRYPQKRDLTAAGERHRKMLAEMMRRGNWRPKDKLDFANILGRFMLLNGHHRLAAQAESGQVIQWTIAVHDCRTVADAEALYWSFDTTTRARTNETILSAIGFDEKLGTSKTIAEAMYRAAPFLANGLYFGRVDTGFVARMIDTRLETALQFAREARLYEEAIAQAPPRIKTRLHTVGAVAVGVVTLRYQPEKAFEFWNGVALNDGLRRGDPRHTYVNLIGGAQAKKGTGSWTANAAAQAWRAFYIDQTLLILRVNDKPQVAVAGTPYKGR